LDAQRTAHGALAGRGQRLVQLALGARGPELGAHRVGPFLAFWPESSGQNARNGPERRLTALREASGFRLGTQKVETKRLSFRADVSPRKAIAVKAISIVHAHSQT
jgi:hypothetical protein